MNASVACGGRGVWCAGVRICGCVGLRVVCGCVGVGVGCYSLKKKFLKKFKSLKGELSKTPGRVCSLVVW